MPTLRPHPRSWLVVSLVAACGFTLLAVLYGTGSPVNRIDVWLGIILHQLDDRHIIWLNTSMEVISFFGGNGSLLVAACVAIYLFRRRSWAELFLWIVAVGGVIILNRLLKDSFETLRPMVGHTDRFEQSTGFPSGHAMAAVVTYGLLAYLAVTHTTMRSVRVVSLLVAGAFIMLISFSRLFLSVHYLSDVLGGLAAGIAWLGACLWLYDSGVLSRTSRLLPFQVGTSQQSTQTD